SGRQRCDAADHQGLNRCLLWIAPGGPDHRNQPYHGPLLIALKDSRSDEGSQWLVQGNFTRRPRPASMPASDVGTGGSVTATAVAFGGLTLNPADPVVG